jgi:hypothetical protein
LAAELRGKPVLTPTHEDYGRSITITRRLLEADAEPNKPGQIVRLPDFSKVSRVRDGRMHLTFRMRNTTLCGIGWYYGCDHGETYCRHCQAALARIMKSRAAGGGSAAAGGKGDDK